MARYLVSRPILQMDTQDLAHLGGLMRRAGADIEAECKKAVWEAAGYVVVRARQNAERHIPVEGGPTRGSRQESADLTGARTIYGGTQTSRAKGYSERIPPSIHAFRTRGLQVFVRAGGSNAPHAKAIENHGEGFVFHYTYGGLPYTRKNSRPAYLQPALEVGAVALQRRTEQAVKDGLWRVVGRER